MAKLANSYLWRIRIVAVRAVADLFALAAGCFLVVGLWGASHKPPLNALALFGFAAACCVGASYSRKVRVAGRCFSFLTVAAQLCLQGRLVQLGTYHQAVNSVALLTLPVVVLFVWSLVDWYTSRSVEPTFTCSIRQSLCRIYMCMFALVTSFVFCFYVPYLFTTTYNLSMWVALALNTTWYLCLAIGSFFAILIWIDSDQKVDPNFLTLHVKVLFCGFACKTVSGCAYCHPDRDWLTAMAFMALGLICVGVISRSPFRIVEDEVAPSKLPLPS